MLAPPPQLERTSDIEAKQIMTAQSRRVGMERHLSDNFLCDSFVCKRLFDENDAMRVALLDPELDGLEEPSRLPTSHLAPWQS